jgi:hypothetical protein
MQIELRDGWGILPGPQAVLVLSPVEFMRALQRGQRWRQGVRDAQPLSGDGNVGELAGGVAPEAW